MTITIGALEEMYAEHVAECPHCFDASKGARIRPLVVRFTPRGSVFRCWECGGEYKLVGIYPNRETEPADVRRREGKEPHPHG